MTLCTHQRLTVDRFDIANNCVEIMDHTETKEVFAELAADFWNRTIQLDPTHTSALYNLGLKCVSQNKISQAYEFLHPIERIDPSNYLALYEVKL